MKIPVIDLFAGPGGLGEGFSALLDENDCSVFEIKLSIEKEESAHKTLTWRSFYRQFKGRGKEVPREYYEALKINDISKRELFIEKVLNEIYPEEGRLARKEAQRIELGGKEWPKNEVDRIIREALGDKPGNWVLIGGPPCQAYSNVGRSRVGGIDPEDHRVYLYQEYLRIIEEHKPAVFVMENVKGLLSAKVGEEKVFDWMKKDLTLNGEYRIYSFVRPVENDRDYLIKSEKYGVPQKRHRVILLGLRKDIMYPIDGAFLEEKPEVPLESVLSKMPPVRSELGRRFIEHSTTEFYSNGNPKREYRNLADSNKAWEKEMNEQIKKLEKWGELSINRLILGVKSPKLGVGGEFIIAKVTIDEKHCLKSWYLDPSLNGLPNHRSRSHLTQDLMRYMFAGLYVEEYKTFPRLDDFAKHHEDLIPDHANVKSGKFTDRFRVQVKGKPATTITSHISKDGHYFIHYDTKQCRSLTVREAARIQTFPDNYLFRGSRTSQFHQVGNAVPPYLAYQLAHIVLSILNENEF